MDKSNKQPRGAKVTKVLVVHDDSGVRQKLTKCINQVGGFVVSSEAKDAVQALSTVEEHQVDLAIVDMSLEQAAEKVKSRHPNLPVLTIPTREFLK